MSWTLWDILVRRSILKAGRNLRCTVIRHLNMQIQKFLETRNTCGNTNVACEEM